MKLTDPRWVENGEYTLFRIFRFTRNTESIMRKYRVRRWW